MQVLSEDEIKSLQDELLNRMTDVMMFLNDKLDKSECEAVQDSIVDMLKMQTDIIVNTAINAIRASNE